MADTNSYTHLTLDERRIILTGITNGSTKAAIAETIGKDNSTVGKEIKAHRVLTHKCHLPLECSAYKKCTYNRNCSPDCPAYFPFKCKRRDRSPGACNGCPDRAKCRFDKYDYKPEQAQSEYRETLTDSRIGVNLTTSEAKDMADVIRPLLKQGLSPYQILEIHPELNVCEKTLYNYIENDVFHYFGDITVMDLRRQVSRKMPKSSAPRYKKREDRKFLNGRTFKDYQSYMDENPACFIAQMDTVYNDETGGPFMQTFKFLCCGLLFAIYHDLKTADEMVSGINELENILGTEVFRKYAGVILTDRGTEFSSADRMETSADGTRRTRIFYCDPMQSGQKGTLENKHIELRYILPKKTDLKALGLTGQDSLNTVLSHVDSAPLESLNGRSPLELAAFLYPDLYEKLAAYGIQEIEKDKIILKPYLLKNR